jgi:hypothetical protein
MVDAGHESLRVSEKLAEGNTAGRQLVCYSKRKATSAASARYPSRDRSAPALALGGYAFKSPAACYLQDSPKGRITGASSHLDGVIV